MKKLFHILIIGCSLITASTNAQILDKELIRQKLESEEKTIKETPTVFQVTNYNKEDDYSFTTNYIFGSDTGSKSYNRLIKVIYTCSDNRVLRTSFWAIVNNSPDFVRIHTNYYYDPFKRLSFSYNKEFGEQYIVINYSKIYEKDSF